jgi:hypothetical protein
MRRFFRLLWNYRNHFYRRDSGGNSWRFADQVALERLLLVKVRDPCSHHEINSPLLGSGRVLSRNLWTDAFLAIEAGRKPVLD